MALQKMVWTKKQTATIQPTAPAAKTVGLTTLDFTDAKIRWIDAPNSTQLFLRHPMLGEDVLIMGVGAKTAYSEDWTDDQAQAAALLALGLTVPPPVVGTAPISTAPKPN